MLLQPLTLLVTEICIENLRKKNCCLQNWLCHPTKERLIEQPSTWMDIGTVV